jgi:hypothetical protein
MSSLWSINWNDVINKEARSSNDEDLGEVQEVDENYIFVQRNHKQRQVLHSNRYGRKL